MSDSTIYIVFLIGAVVLITACAITLLRREESRYRRLLISHEQLSTWTSSLEECVGQAMITSDAQGRIHGYNPAAKELFGYSIEEIQSHNILELFPPDANGKDFSSVDRTRDSAGRKVQAVKKDGTCFQALLKISTTQIGTQVLLRFLVEDLKSEHDRERAQQETQILRAALNAAGLMVALLSPEGRIVRISRECADQLEVSPSDAEGAIFWELFQRKEDWPSAAASFEQAKNSPFPRRSKANWITRTQRQIPLEWLTLKPVWDQKGTLTHILAIAAPALSAAPAQPPRDPGTTERIVGRIARYFESLLSTINGYGELVLQELDGASPIRQDVEEIVAASQAACDTTQQLITFSGHRLILLEPLDLGPLLEARGFRIEPDTASADSLPPVLGNREAFAEMLGILAEYTDPFAGPHRWVKQDTTDWRFGDLEPGGYLRLSLALTRKPGAESPESLFEPFHARSSGPQANTVGLAVVYGIVRSCWGGIVVTEAPDGTAILDIMLPLAAESGGEQRGERRGEIRKEKPQRVRVGTKGSSA